VAVLGRRSARQRRRRATQESLTIPPFGSFIDCTPWVTGGLWPQELARLTAETAPLANYLNDDLQRIIRAANGELALISRTRPRGFARQATEAHVIDEARARAARRIESTVRQLRAITAAADTGHQRPPRDEKFAGIDIGATQVIPAVTDVELALDAPNPTASRPEAPSDGDHHGPARINRAAIEPLAGDGGEPEVSTGRHRASDDDEVTGGPAGSCGVGRARDQVPDHTSPADHHGPARNCGASRPDHRRPGDPVHRSRP
jgi:hypothetical protein